MSKQYNSKTLITVYDVDRCCNVDSCKNLDEFCAKYNLSEADARKSLSNNITFICDTDKRSYIAFQGKYDKKLAYKFLIKEMYKVFGEPDEYNIQDNAWVVCRITDNPYAGDDPYTSSYYSLSDRTIILTPNYISISNNRHLTSKYPYEGLVLKRSAKNGTGEACLYYKGNLLGLYSNERVAERKAVVEKRNPCYTPVVAVPMFADDEQKVFESIHQSAKFFGVHLTTIKNKIKTGKYIDKDNVFYSLKFLGE